MTIFSVRFLALGLPLLLPSCAFKPHASHGPISDKLQRQLEKNAISRETLASRLRTGDLKFSQGPAAENQVTVPFRLIDDTPVLDVAVNGRRHVPVQLDTGAARSMLGASDAVASQVAMLRAEDAIVWLRGVIGDEKGRLGILQSLKIGSWELYGYTCVVRTHDNVLRRGFGSKTFSSNLLGFDIAAQHASFLTLDYRAGKMTYGFRTPFPTPTGPRVARTPFKIRQGVPFVTLRAGRNAWEALVDTGSFNGIELSSQVADQLGLKGKGQAVKGLYLMSVGGSADSADIGLRMVTLPEFRGFGGYFKDMRAAISPGVARVGSFFLKDYRVTFDFHRRLIWLEP